MLGFLGWCVIFISQFLILLACFWVERAVCQAGLEHAHSARPCTKTAHLWEEVGSRVITSSTLGVLLSYSHYKYCFDWSGEGLHFWCCRYTQSCSLTHSVLLISKWAIPTLMFQCLQCLCRGMLGRGHWHRVPVWPWAALKVGVTAHMSRQTQLESPPAL